MGIDRSAEKKSEGAAVILRGVATTVEERGSET